MLLLKLLLLLQAGFVPLMAARNQIPELSLSKDKSFKLRTFVSHVVEGAPARFRYLFDESYSSEQKRAVVKYKTLGEGREDWFKTASVPFAGTIFLDGPTRPPLVVFNSFINYSRCKELDWWKFEQLCQIDVIKSLSNNKQILDDDLSRAHGPSNLLFWFESIRDELVQVKTTLGVEVRGIPSLMFKHQFTGSESAQTYSYYAKSQVGIGGKGMPLRITIDYEHGKFVQYDFHTSSEMRSDQTMDSQLGGSEYFANDLTFDEFFIPRAVGCGSAGNQSDIASLSRLTSYEESFSLTAQLTQSIDGQDMLQHVVYDRKLNLMRIDQELGERKFNSLIDFIRGQTHRLVASPNDVDVAAVKLTTLAARSSDKAECIVMKSPKMGANMNLVLFGSRGGNWRYLGLAQMRGMRARVFELYDSEWPVWLRQPISCSKNWNDDKEDPDEVCKATSGAGLKLNTVVYIQDNGQSMDRPAEGSGNLIGVEIFFMNDNTNKMVKRLSIAITDFTWRVSQMGTWKQISDVFSIADQCAASQELNQHVRASISLSSDSLFIVDGAKEDFAVNHKRDLSLIESLQFDLGIPGSMIYDLSSRIEFEGQQTRIDLTFLMAKSKQPLVRLRFYGTGTVKLKTLAELTTLSASLADCFTLTSQRKVNTFFGYSSRYNLCTVESKSGFSVMVPRDEKVRPKYFDLVKDGPIDVYFVHHDLDADEPDLVTELRDLSRRSKAGEEQLMKKLWLPVPYQRIMKAPFVVQSFQISDIYDTRDQQLPQIDPKGARELHSFGLVPDSDLVRLHTFGAGKGGQIGQSNQMLDFASCQMACLLDTTCKTFSYCLRGARVECALTSVDFGDANLVFQLIDNMQNRQAKMITLKVDHNKEIRVKQQASCELRQKSYLDLYSRSKRQLKASKMADLVISSIPSGREGCARRCFDQTETVLPKLAALPDQINSNLEEMLADPDRASPRSDRVFEQQASTGRELCLGFFYLDALNINSLPDIVADRFQMPPENQNREANFGFCITKKKTQSVDSNVNPESDADQQLIDLEEFMFKFETTYEPQPGLKLLEVEKTSLERETLRKFSELERSPIEPAELEVLKGLIEGRKNIQSVLMTGSIDLAICARACAMQLAGPWPACRSFDMVVHSSGLSSTNTLCYLNSISYADAVEAGRSDHISFNRTPLRMQTHYEPIFDTGGLARWRPASNNDDTQSMSTASFAALTISAIGLITGLLLGGTISGRVPIFINKNRPLLNDHQRQIQDDLDTSYNLASIAAH